MIVIDNKFENGQVVYLKTDTEQTPRIVTGFSINGEHNSILYKLSCGTCTCEHYSYEISCDKDVLITTT